VKFQHYDRVWVVDEVHQQYAQAFNDRLNAQRSILIAALAGGKSTTAEREFLTLRVSLYGNARESDETGAGSR